MALHGQFQSWCPTKGIPSLRGLCWRVTAGPQTVWLFAFRWNNEEHDEYIIFGYPILAFCLQIAQGLPCISTIINKWLRLRFSRGRLGEHSADMGHMQTFHAWSTYPPVTVENPPLVDHFRLSPMAFPHPKSGFPRVVSLRSCSGCWHVQTRHTRTWEGHLTRHALAGRNIFFHIFPHLSYSMNYNSTDCRGPFSASPLATVVSP